MLPIRTTTVSILRAVAATMDAEPRYDGDTPATQTVVARGIGANISNPSARESRASGSQLVTSMRMQCDPFGGPITHFDSVRDDTTGVTYAVDSVLWRSMLGYWQCSLTKVEGLQDAI